MKKNPRESNYTTPLQQELGALFAAIPESDLLASLESSYYAGRIGYTYRVMWRTYVAMFYLNISTFANLIRMLQDNPNLREACGIITLEGVPSPHAYSRFIKKLSKLGLVVKNILRGLTRRLYDTFPGFGKSVAIDSTDIKGWSNGGKRGKKGKVSDVDAGWIVKTNTEGNRKYVWGYKVHILCDTETELPMAVSISQGNLHDVNKAGPLLQEARVTNSKFHPDYVICDKAYSADSLRKLIKRQYRAEPIIDPNLFHKKAVANTEKTAEWKAIYNRRVSIERLNGRLKSHRRLDAVTVRGRFKVRIHAMLSIIVCQAQALATGSRASVRKV